MPPKRRREKVRRRSQAEFKKRVKEIPTVESSDDEAAVIAMSNDIHKKTKLAGKMVPSKNITDECISEEAIGKDKIYEAEVPFCCAVCVCEKKYPNVTELLAKHDSPWVQPGDIYLSEENLMLHHRPCCHGFIPEEDEETEHFMKVELSVLDGY